MTQHDYDIANQGFSGFRGDLNNALLACVTQNSGASAPTTTFAGQLWYDTTNGIMKQRNAGNTAWSLLYPVGNDGMSILRNAGTPQGALAAWFVGQICLDTTNKQVYVATVADGTIGGTTWKRDVFYNSGLPTRYHGSAPPRPASNTPSTSYVVDYILERDEADTFNIIKNTPTTLSASTTGINAVAVSNDLAGTIGTGGVSSTTITGSGTSFLSDFIVGDVINTVSSGGGIITAISTNTSLTVASATTISNGTSYYRNGSTAVWHHLYAVAKSSDGTAGLLLSPRDVSGGDTLVDLPSGYDKYRQLAWAIKSTSYNSYVEDGWPWKPTILFDAQFTAPGDSNPMLNLDNGSATSFTTLETRSTSIKALPKIAKSALFYVSANTGGLQFYLRPGGSNTNGRRFNLGAANDDVYTGPVSLNPNGQYDYKVSGNSVDISLYGYVAYAK